ncbi:hypothetical protein ATANTOWER_025212 [Ataeniobius toweri]|uniref:Murine leukemia virus integrase C-terminal domain-containing protein n=1 Tax=Ataeniobius toweri TaxID=208326 RepID=A0ABU7A8S4_9TELE|nr:hypothetical protein [Ataeniobius toweri]
MADLIKFLISKKDLKDPQQEATLADYMMKALQFRDIQNVNNLPNDVSEALQVPGDVKEGDWVLIKTIKKKAWSDPKWECPFQVLLTTPTAVKIQSTQVSLPIFPLRLEMIKPDYKGVVTI